ncbi:excalibur calcium-binding domain-containing protein [Streptomyces sp. NPDC054854]
MYSPPAQHAPCHPQQPAQRWWQRPAVIITALVLLPPLGIALAWMTRWTQGKKIVATVLSGLWFLIVLFSGDDKAAGDAKPGATSATDAPANAASPNTAATLPPVVSMRFDQAEKALKGAGVAKVTALSVYTDVPLASYHSTWGVCFQDPAAGAAAADSTLHLVAPGSTCPAAIGTRLHVEVTQTPAPPKEDAEGTSGTGGGGSAYYKNCDAAKAAGAAPIRKGQPGYRSALDKDGDGIACDK